MASEISFDEIVRMQEEVDAQRKKMERYVLYAVIIFSLMGLTSAGLTSSTIQSIVMWFSPSGGHNASFVRLGYVSGNDWSHNSSQEWPTFNNSFVRFNVTVSDVDLNDWHTMFVCNTTDSNYTLDQDGVIFRYGCGGNHLQLCNYSDKIMVTDNPMYCDFDVAGWTNQTQNFTLFVLDSGAKMVWVNGSFAGDRPPRIINIHLTKAT